MNQDLDDEDETGGDDYLPHEGKLVRPLGITQIDRNADFWGLIVCVGIAILILLGIGFVGHLMFVWSGWVTK